MIKKDIMKWSLSKPPEKPPFNCWGIFKKFAFFYNDGIAFFGLAAFKVPRLLGKAPGCLDKYKGPRGIFTYVLSFFLLVYILID